MKKVQLITDGSCIGNPGPGGWAYILCCGDSERELTGGEPRTTNNGMELTAAINGLRALARMTDRRRQHLLAWAECMANRSRSERPEFT